MTRIEKCCIFATLINKKSSYMETKSTKLSLRVYRNEYTFNQFRYIHTHFCVLDYSENVLTIIAEESEINKIMSLMYSTDEQFKSLFPDFLTEEERRQNNVDLMKRLDAQLGDILLEMGSKGIVLDEMYNLVESFSKITRNVLRSNNYQTQ